LALIFPEYDLIHLNTYKSDKIKNYMKDNFKNSSHVIETNIKVIAEPKGFTAWTNIYNGALIMSSDLNIGHMITGTILGTACLNAGRGYINNCCTIKSRWEQFFEGISINPINALGGCSELLSSKIIYDEGLTDSVLYCERINGLPCNACTKCFRKQLELNYHGANFDMDIYDEKYISRFLLDRRPLYFNHIFLYILKYIDDKNKLPKYLEKKIYDLKNKNIDFVMKIYSNYYQKYPNKKDYLIKQIKNKLNCSIFDNNDNINIEKFI
jgi:hypothetical protein